MLMSQETIVIAEMMQIPAYLWLPVPIQQLGLWFLNPGCVSLYFSV